MRRHVSRNARHLRSKSPAGVSLIEVVVIMSVASVMLGISVTGIHLLLRTERNVASVLWYSQSLQRMALRLRDDIHNAADIELPNAEPNRHTALVVQLPGGSAVEYTIDGEQLIRALRNEEGVQHRDALYLPPGSQIHFERSSEPEVVRLVIERPALHNQRTDKPALGRLRELRVEAVVGRHRRWDRQEDAQ